jgi:phosphatidylglycerol:prolipoprotein diacylglycerol transferase
MLVLSIDPILTSFGNFVLTWHGLFFASGAGVIYIWAVHSSKSQGFSRTLLSEFAVWCIIAIFLFARLVWVFSNIDKFRDVPLDVIRIDYGGISASGGIFGIVLAVLFFTQFKKLSFPKFLDLIISATPPGALIGRIGCLIQGDIHGVQSSQNWGLVYLHPASSIPTDLLGKPTIPIIPLMMLCMSGIWAILSFLKRKKLKPGSLFTAFLILYGFKRLVLGFWQAGEIVMGGMKTFQITGLFLLFAGFIWWGWLVIRKTSKAHAVL